MPLSISAADHDW